MFWLSNALLLDMQAANGLQRIKGSLCSTKLESLSLSTSYAWRWCCSDGPSIIL